MRSSGVSSDVSGASCRFRPESCIVARGGGCALRGPRQPLGCVQQARSLGPLRCVCNDRHVDGRGCRHGGRDTWRERPSSRNRGEALASPAPPTHARASPDRCRAMWEPPPPPPPVPLFSAAASDAHSRASDAGSVKDTASDAGSTATMDTSMSASNASTAYYPPQAARIDASAARPRTPRQRPAAPRRASPERAPHSQMPAPRRPPSPECRPFFPRRCTSSLWTTS